MTRCPCGNSPCAWYVPQPYRRLLDDLWDLLFQRMGKDWRVAR